MSRTLLDRIWDTHVVSKTPGHPSVVYIDLHLVHEVTSPQAFVGLRRRGLRVRRPDRTLATMDHSTPTEPARVLALSRAFAEGETRPSPDVVDSQAHRQLITLRENCRAHGIELLELGRLGQGIVHVIGPERGRTLPGTTIVCGDSHTSTHGAFGALAFGIGTSEVETVLATQCLLLHKPKALEVRFVGRRDPSVTAKDLALALIARIGADGGTGAAFEYTGEAVRSLDMEGRMTLCNMSIEAGARAGMVAPDDTTFAFLEETPERPRGAAWERAIDRWSSLRTDDPSAYDATIELDATELAPMVTYGTHPGMAIPIDGRIPEPDGAGGDRAERALRYMGLEPGSPIAGRRIDVVFIGSCTNARLGDLRAAASVLRGRRIAKGVRMLVVPGSTRVKAEAEAEGLDRIFREAGAEWRSPGCSMCIAMNEDRADPGQYVISTSNRNFEGRQGPGSRTFLASPATAAASAVQGCVADPRPMGGAA